MEQATYPPFSCWVRLVAPVEITGKLQLTIFNRTVIKKEEKLERKEEKGPEDIKKEKDQDELPPGTASHSRVTKSGKQHLGCCWERWRPGGAQGHGQEADKSCYLAGSAADHVMEPKDLFCRSGLVAQAITPLFRTVVREIVIKTTLDSIECTAG